MNPLSWSADTWLWLCEWGGLVAAAASVLLLFGALRAGKAVNDRQSLELERLKADVAKQQERAAKAEQDLIKALQQLARLQSPRMLPRDKFIAALKGKFKKATVEILYRHEDLEAYGLALQLYDALGKEDGGVGWDVTRPKPLPLTTNPEDDEPSETRFIRGKGYGFVPQVSSLGGSGGVYVAAPEEIFPGQEPRTPSGAIINVLYVLGFSDSGKIDPSMPNDSCIIVVGQKIGLPVFPK